MAMSGVELTDEAKITYEEIYKGKKHRYEFNKDLHHQIFFMSLKVFCTFDREW